MIASLNDDLTLSLLSLSLSLSPFIEPQIFSFWRAQTLESGREKDGRRAHIKKTLQGRAYILYRAVRKTNDDDGNNQRGPCLLPSTQRWDPSE